MLMKRFTLLGRLYTVAWFGLIIFGSAGSIAASLSERIPLIWLDILLGLLAVAVVIGIVQHRIWAQWLAIALYSWYVIRGVGIILNLPWFLPPLAKLFVSAELKIVNSVIVLFSVLGIFLLLQKPKVNSSR